MTKKEGLRRKENFSAKNGFGKYVKKMWGSIIKVKFESSRYNKKCFTKKMQNQTNFLYANKKSLLGCLKCKKTCNFLKE